MVSQHNPSNELYNLRWNSYFTNLVNVFIDHQTQETLVDVTLSCEGQFIKAHKLVLSACSVYFQKIFENHTGPQLLIILNDVKFKNLQLVVQFMYKGEVKVGDADMEQFLALGKMLQVKGLCSVELQDKQSKTQIEEIKTVKEPKIKLTESTAKNTKQVQTTLKKRKVASPHSQDNKKKCSKPSSPVSDDSHIPRPPNAFMIFANQWRKKLAVEYPNESNKDISVRLGNMWKSLSTETKDAFYEDARKADEEHKQKYPGYYYSPKEARHRKAIASISKTVQKLDSSSSSSIESVDINEPEFVEIKCEGGASSSDSRNNSNGTTNGTNV